MAEGGYYEPHTEENYRDNDTLYTVKPSLLNLSITITFGSQNIYSTFKRIIFKQYPEDLFKPIPNIRGIVHTFTYKNEKKVAITLYTSSLKLLTQGNGCREWFHEEFEKLGKQLHIKMNTQYYQNKRSQQAIAYLQHSSEQMVEQKPASSVSSQQEEQGQHISKQPSNSTVSSQQEEQGQHISKQQSTSTVSSQQEEQGQHISKQPSTTTVSSQQEEQGQPISKQSSTSTVSSQQEEQEQHISKQPSTSTLSSQQEEQGQPISKQPSTSTVSSLLGANKILLEEEFNNTFAHPYKYGKRPEDWPKRTILLYTYKANAIQQYTYIPENTWKKVVNIPGKHAELIMIDQLREIQKYLVKQPENHKDILSIEVILSNSPCSNCSKELCSLMNDLDKNHICSKMGALSLNEVEEKDKIQFKITFSNFYKHMEKPYGIYNMQGLKNLLMNDIKLEILTEDNWPYAWNAAGLDTEKQRKDRDSKTERKQREMDDKKIFQYLKELVAVEVTRRDLKSQNLL